MDRFLVESVKALENRTNPFKAAFLFEIASHLFQLAHYFDPHLDPQNPATLKTWFKFANLKADRQLMNLRILVSWISRNPTVARPLVFKLLENEPELLSFESFGNDNNFINGSFVIEETRGGSITKTVPFQSFKENLDFRILSHSGLWFMEMNQILSTDIVDLNTMLSRSIDENWSRMPLKDSRSLLSLAVLLEPKFFSNQTRNEKSEKDLAIEVLFTLDAIVLGRLSQPDVELENNIATLQRTLSEGSAAFRQVVPLAVRGHAVEALRKATHNSEYHLANEWAVQGLVNCFTESKDAEFTLRIFEVILESNDRKALAALREIESGAWTIEKRGQFVSLIKQLEERVNESSESTP